MPCNFDIKLELALKTGFSVACERTMTLTYTTYVQNNRIQSDKMFNEIV